MAHLTVDERAARGKRRRSEVPRSAHGEWAPARGRPDPVALLEEQAASRVPELVPIRYGRMAASSFAFYRGAAYVMAWDLAHTPTSGIRAQLCGDAHLANFGGFASPERELVFDLDDFDETLPGPWEWDVKRLAASVEVAARDRGFGAKKRRRLVRGTVAEYRAAMRRFASMKTIDVWYAHLSAGELTKHGSHLSPAHIKRFERTVAHHASDTARIASEPPSIAPVASLLEGPAARDLDAAMRALIEAYAGSLAPDRRRLVERFRYAECARRVAGVGSVGTRTWVVLMLGRDADDRLLLQVKEAQPSVLEPFAGAGGFASQGRRVVEGQKLMQAASDICLGWVDGAGIDGRPRDFYVRQLRDGKRSADLEALRPKRLAAYARLCAWTLARAHARSSDPIAIGAYLGSGRAFDDALTRFATAYADQNARDHRALLEAIADRRIEAAPEA